MNDEGAGSVVTSDYMSIRAQSGTQVRFTARGGYDHEKADAERFLTVGELYTVKSIFVDRFCSYVTLREFPDHQYNTDLFFRKGAKWP